MDLDATRNQLRRAITALGATSRARRYPVTLQREIVAWAGAARAAGLSWPRIALGLGVPSQSISRWAAEQAAAPTVSTLRPVEVRTEGKHPGLGSITLRSPSGFVVEVHGAEVGWVAELLGRLG